MPVVSQHIILLQFCVWIKSTMRLIAILCQSLWAVKYQLDFHLLKSSPCTFFKHSSIRCDCTPWWVSILMAYNWNWLSLTAQVSAVARINVAVHASATLIFTHPLIQFLIQCCGNDVRMVWWWLGTKTTWLGLGKHCVLTEKKLFRHLCNHSVTTNRAGNRPEACLNMSSGVGHTNVETQGFLPAPPKATSECQVLST